MPADMKPTIAQAAMRLLMERGVKKLTVKDIVEECHITRQAFYYHFEDIPELFRWMLEQGTDRMLRDVLSQGSAEEGLRRFFITAVHAIPYVKRGMDSNYGPELEQLLRQYTQRFFDRSAEKRNFYAGSSPAESRFILRYHRHAIMGLLREWTEEDTAHLDDIVRTVCRLMADGIQPQDRTT